MSIPTRRGSSSSAIPSSMPPPARAWTGSGVADPNRPHQYVIPRFVGHGTHETGGDEESGVGLQRRRVLPPSGFGGVMNSGYFSNLMSSAEFGYPREADLHEQHLDDNPGDEEAPVREDATAAAKDKKRSKNFSVEEDKLLVSAWLNVSQDPIQGVDQARSTYWSRIYNYFHSNKNFDSDRSQGSLQNRWSGIQHDVNVFAGCISRIEARNQSGCSIDDKVASACALFKEEDKLHRNFPYMHCWKVLKDQAKWIERRKHISTPKPPAKKQKTTTKSSPSSAPPIGIGVATGDDQQSESAPERPAGKKKEKHILRQRSGLEAMEYLVSKKKEADTEKDMKKEERCKKAFALQEERNRIERDKVEMKKKMEEERIMNIDLSTLSYKQRQYYEIRQDEILAKHLDN